MKQFYILFIFIFTISNLFAQHNSNYQVHMFDTDVNYPQVKLEEIKAAGDTVFLFDGRYIGGKGINKLTFNYSKQDLDNLTINAAYTGAGYPSKASFVPSYDTITRLDTNFYFITVSYFVTPGKANDWISFGPIAIPASGATLSWKHNYPNSKFRDGYKLHINTVGIGAANFTASPIYTMTDNDASTVADTIIDPYSIFSGRSKDISAYAGQTIYLGFQHDANDMEALSIDDILIKENVFVGVEKNELSGSLNIFPNPTEGLFTINFGSSEKYHVEVYNSIGVIVYSSNFNSATASIDLTNIEAGVYSIKVTSANNRTSLKQLVIIK